MDTKALRIFAAVAETGSISRAAEKLHYVQSNVSARIQQLEEELGTELFYRQHRGMHLSNAGKVLKKYADETLHLLTEARKAVHDTLSCGGSLTLGAMETTAAVRLPDVLIAYHRQYPHVDLDLTTATSGELIKLVLEYQVDGALISGEVEHPDLITFEVFCEKLVLVTSPDISHINQLKQPPTLFSFRRGCTYRAKVEQWAREQGYLPTRIMEFGSLDAIIGCAAAGLGVALIPESVVCRPHYINQVNYFSLPEHIAHSPTLFIRHKNTLLTQAMQAFLQLLMNKNQAIPHVKGVG